MSAPATAADLVSGRATARAHAGVVGTAGSGGIAQAPVAIVACSIGWRRRAKFSVTRGRTGDRGWVVPTASQRVLPVSGRSEHRFVASQSGSPAPSSNSTARRRPVRQVAPECYHPRGRRPRDPRYCTVPIRLRVEVDLASRSFGYDGLAPLRLGDPRAPGGVGGSDRDLRRSPGLSELQHPHPRHRSRSSSAAAAQVRYR